MASLSCVLWVVSAAGQTGAREPKPVDAVQGILAAFKHHAIVLIGEGGHWLRQAGDFYVRLVRDPSFPETVRDIVVEFASRNNQPILDRYIAGEDVPIEDVRRMWRDTSKAAAWESPIYANLLAAIREINKKLPAARRLRVLAGDTPIDWKRIRTHEEWVALGGNDRSFAGVIVTQVLEKKRRALVILGNNHVTKSRDGDNTTSLVESRYPGSTYVAAEFYRGLVDPATEALLRLSQQTTPVLFDLAGTTAGPALNMADGVLYLGPPESLTMELPPAGSIESAYMEEADRRQMIEFGDLRIRRFLEPYLAGIQPLLGSPRMAALRRRLEKGDHRALDEFWQDAKRTGTPLIEPAYNPHEAIVTFVRRGDASTQSVGLLAPLLKKPGMPNLRLDRMLDKNLWYVSWRMRDDIRFTYRFVTNVKPGGNYSHEDITVDPLNPNHITVSYDEGVTSTEFSIAAMAHALDESAIVKQPNVPAGKVELRTLKSAILNTDRKIWVYTPPSYEEKPESAYWLLVLFDGFFYQGSIPTATILDNLIHAEKAPPMIAVLIDNPPVSRGSELGYGEPFVQFLSGEVVPWIRRHWNVTHDPGKCIIGGFSMGGSEAAFVAMRHPELFGNVLSQSGSFADGGPNAKWEWLASQYQASPKLPLRFFIEEGLLEDVSREGPTGLDANRRFATILKGKGYPITYEEICGSHEPLHWRGALAEGLTALIGLHKF